ncbi:hypothetical protein RI129_013104 [Pyrocoelia pectoralis]|uniref:Cytochrome P450 n=1 Tax=Pyrocoelia pectoralis TaxID=417401 RepID=A0AAN7V8J9_9COLE
MGIISSCACTEIFAVLVTCVIGVITFFKWKFKYWERKNVPYITPHFPFGTMQNLFHPKVSFGVTIRNQYMESKQKGLKHVGLFTLTKPTYMPIDLECVKSVLSSDFKHFVDRGVYHNEKDDPLSANLASLEGSRWKNLRTKLTPTFTSGKMKMMFPLLLECGKQMIDALAEICDQSVPIDIKDWLGRFGTDVIGTCAFGIDCNSFKEPNSDFRTYGKRALYHTKWENAKIFLGFSNAKLAKKLGIRTTPVEVTNFFFKVIEDTVNRRRDDVVTRNDFLQILLDLTNSTDEKNISEKQHLTIAELTAQAFLFFLAGFESSSTAMTFCLYELAVNQDIQQRVREEIVSVLEEHDGVLTYETIKQMIYLKQVVDETLRKYPPVPHLIRRCVLDYKIPGTNIVIEKGTAAVVSAYGLHYDPEYHPDPEKFNPERFSASNKGKTKPFTYIPFGEGPRMCIGFRFGFMQVGVGLALLLKNFRFTLSDKTNVPLRMNPQSFVLSVVDDIWLNLHKI